MFILEYGVTNFPCTLRYFSSSGDESALIYFHPCPGLLVIKKLKIKKAAGYGYNIVYGQEIHILLSLDEITSGIHENLIVDFGLININSINKLTHLV